MKILNRWTQEELFDTGDKSLRGADLCGADLCGADLRGANLRGANLCGADLSEADLSEADLYGANLRGANLRGADLRGANLRGADLSEADLSEADLYGANLRGANLRGADLRGANLRGADLSEADLSEADLYGAKNISALICAQLSIIPAGDIYGWKKCRDNFLVCLLIESDSRRSNATGRKCRAEKALVVSIEKEDFPKSRAISQADSIFIYEIGKYVSVDNFDIDRWNECSSGIHFFLTKEEAEAY